MNETPSERLLRRLATVETDRETPEVAVDGPLSDQTLEAYRRGDVTHEDRAAIEARLVASPADRVRWLAQAGEPPLAPSPRVREAVLAAVEGPRPRTAWRVVAIAASLVLALGYCFLPARDLPRDLTFQVRASGLVADRGGAVAEVVDIVEAYAETPLVVEVTPRGPARDGLAFALYRPEGDGWTRLSEADGLRVDTERGAATLRLERAGAVAGSPGEHTVLVVVAREDDLPSTVVAASTAEARVALDAGGRRRVSALRVELSLPGTPTGDPSIPSLSEERP